MQRTVFRLLTMLCPILYGCDVSWLDVNNTIWDIIPEYTSTSNLDFGEEKTTLDFHLKNDGQYNEITYNITTNVNWASVSQTSGRIDKGADHVITVTVNRDNLDEGDNKGKLLITLDEGDERSIDISAIGGVDIRLTPELIDFGSSSSAASLSLSSMTGNRRVLFLSSSVSWANLSDNRLILPLFTGTNDDEGITVGIKCDRSNLETGIHEGEISIKSENGVYNNTVKIKVTIPEQSEIVQKVGDFDFIIKKAPYRNGGNSTVTIELSIHNSSSIYTHFELNGNNCYAIDNNSVEYSITASPINIKANETDIMYLSVHNVDDSEAAFTTIRLNYASPNLPNDVIFNDIDF